MSLNSVVYPTIYNYWLEKQAENVNEALQNQSETGGVRVAGDARFDSAGYSAMFATYYMQDIDTKKVLGVYVAKKQQVSYSAEMEVFAMKTLLNWFEEIGLKIRVLVTDRSRAVRKTLIKEYKYIKHEFDPWHYVKNIKNKIYSFSGRKDCKILLLWQKSVINTIWYALADNKGNPERAKQVLVSILNHVSNIHSFSELPLFDQCAHEPLEEERVWIEQGNHRFNLIQYLCLTENILDSIAWERLRLAIFGKNGCNLDDVDFMTGNLEVIYEQNFYMPLLRVLSH